jgi:hypothetical protein
MRSQHPPFAGFRKMVSRSARAEKPGHLAGTPPYRPVEALGIPEPLVNGRYWPG